MIQPIRRCCTALLLLASAVAAHAADPVLFKPSLRDLDAVPLRATTATALTKSLAQPVDTKVGNLRYGVAVPLAIGLADGVWDAPEVGVSRWRARVFSAGAQSISVAFSRFAVPADGALWIYDSRGALVQGPYTAAMAGANGELWTALVQDETAVLELRVPTAEKSAVDLKIDSVDHGYRDISKAGIGSGDSGSCNIDVACSQGDNWRDEIREVAAYTVRVGANSVICTGQLINNARQDSTPYFLSANHCGLSSDNAASMVVYWQLQRSNCGTGSGDLTKNQTGATFLASEAKSDFALVRLNQTPASSFNVRFAGWNITDTAPTSGVAIHHPEGDVKKISVYGSGTTAADNACAGTDALGNCNFRVDAWQVRWTQGTTEGGSSGAGLLNQNKQLIGVLSGGGASCSTPTQPDFFGRLSKAWQAGCTSSSQLKAWLDPDNSGLTSLCGQFPGAVCNSNVRTTGTTAPGTVATSGCSAGTTPTAPAEATTAGGSIDYRLLSLLCLALLLRAAQRRPFMPRRRIGVSSR